MNYPAALPRRRSKAGIVIATLLIVFSLAFGFVAGNLASGLRVFDIASVFGLPAMKPFGSNWGKDPTRPVLTSEFVNRIDEVSAILDREALHVFTEEEIDQATRIAIEGLLLASGDMRAEYYDAEEYAAYQASSSGEYVGIGVTLQNGLDGRVTVFNVFSDSPASEAGVEPGDVLLAVDNVFKDWEIDDAVSTIRRENGKPVSIIWERDGERRVTNMNVRIVKRQIVRFELIAYEGHQVGYIYLDQFTDNCANEVRSAIKSLDTQGAECFILDLRDNPGGFLYQSIMVASLFIKDGVIVRIEERNSTIENKTMGMHETDKPLVILINGGSASASELVTAAFQDHDRAIVVGELSYGKGTVQDIRELSFGGAIKYTIAHYLSPNNRVIDGIGVIPDIIVDDGNRLNDADIIHMLENGEELDLEALGIDPDAKPGVRPRAPGEAGYVYQKGDDIQLDKALEVVIQSL
jgi:carboxyl-terminal processing protease